VSTAGRFVSDLRIVLRGRDFVIPDDVKTLVVPTLAHRIIITADAAMTGRTPAVVLRDLLEEVPVAVSETG